VLQTDYLQVGAYIVQYKPSEEAEEPLDILRTDLVSAPTITPLPVEALRRRLTH
jgi:hypothetical protein